MERFTRKVNEEDLPMGFGGDNYRFTDEYIFGENPNSPTDKLGAIEDLEEELGIDLLILFKVIKQDYIYYKHYYAWDNKFKINKEYLTGLKCIDDNTIALFTDDYYGKEHIVYLKDYGTKWSLRKEELEDEKED